MVAVEGIRSAGVKATSVSAQQPADDGADAARDKAEVEELAAGGTTAASGAESGDRRR